MQRRFSRLPLVLSIPLYVSNKAPASSNCSALDGQITCTPFASVPAGGPYDLAITSYAAMPTQTDFGTPALQRTFI